MNDRVRCEWRRLSELAGCLAAIAVLVGCSEDAGRTGSPVMPGPAQAGMAAGPIAGVGGPVPAAGASGAPPAAGTGASGTPAIAGSPAGAGTGASGMAAVAGTGAGEAGSAGGSEPQAGAGGGEPAAREDLGQGDGQDVITIGDSWMNFILTGIEQSLARASGRPYRNFAVPGTLMLNEQIPGQYATAKGADADIKTVVMTGGGNDILASPCTGAACEPIVDDVSERLTALQAEMAADGVQDVIIIGYTYPSDEGKHRSLEYSIELSNAMCVKTAMPRCHFIDSTMLDITLQDGIHPNAAGYDLIGQTVWELMQAEGMRR